MQVKKFEARTMKEALEMVKTQLGPDAIILSARDNNRSYGLVGQGSVEITAAVTEETLRKKQFAESRLREEDRQKLMKSPARVQRKIIDEMVDSYVEKNEEPKRITQQRYIDIPDQESANLAANPANERIRTAAQKAWSAMQTTGSFEETSAAMNQPVATKANNDGKSTELNSLRQELSTLKATLAQFQNIPQTLTAGAYPGSDYGLSYQSSVTFQKLIEAGIAEDLAAQMLSEAEKTLPPIKLKSRPLVDGFVAKKILTLTEVVGDKNHRQLQIFVGPSGSGKTSSLVKLASHYVVRENKKVALLTMDNRKVGAVEQMRIYAQILNVPFAVIKNKSDWAKVETQLAGYDHILVDAPGMSLRDMNEISFLRNLLPDTGATVHLVLSSLAKDTDLIEIGKRYEVTGFNDVIFTGIDESVQHGNILNFSMRFKRPLHSFGLGQRVPEDFEMATKERVLDLIFKISGTNREATL